MDMIVLGQVERITARHGEVLQLRPKAANARALTEAIGARGEPILTLPRGFYLKKILRRRCWLAIFIAKSVTSITRKCASAMATRRTDAR